MQDTSWLMAKANGLNDITLSHELPQLCKDAKMSDFNNFTFYPKI